MTVNWKDWLTGCSVALATGVLVGALHGAVRQPALPAPPGADSAVLPAPEGNSQLTRPTNVGSAHTGQQAPSNGGRTRTGPVDQTDPARAAAGKPPPKNGPVGGAPATSRAPGPPAGPTTTPSTPATPTDPGATPDPGASGDPGAPTPTAPPTGSGAPTDPGQPANHAA
jgi:hypothetical protein